MAENDIKISGISYEDDKIAFLKNIFQEAKDRQDELEELNIENRLFYEGIDEKLNMRANNQNVDMSHLFIHQLKPAIDTRKSTIVSAVEERERPITIKPMSSKPTDKEREQSAEIEKRINEQLREIGYLMDGFEEHISAAEIYRSPSAVKFSVIDGSEKKPVLVTPTLMEQAKALVRGVIPKPRVKWVTKDKVEFKIEYIPPDQFLYEPNVSCFEKSQYAIHLNYVYPHELDVMAEELGWDMKKFEEFKEKFIEQEGVLGDGDDSIQDKIDSERDVPHKKKKHDDKIMVQEIYLATYDELGEEQIRQIYMLENEHVVLDSPSPYKGVRFPFVLAVADKLPGTLEGLSAVDIGKQTQRLYNELFNMYVDAVGYTTFKPLKKDVTTHFTKQPKWGLGEIWELVNGEGLTPLVDNNSQIPNLPPLMQAVASLLRSNLDAEDIQQGFQSNPNEKATSTQLRTMGAARKSFSWRRRYGMVLVEIAKILLALNQQFADDKEVYVLDVMIDVPSLTNVTDPDQEKQDVLLLLNQMMQMPVFQTPLGQLKVRNMLQNVFEKFLKTDWQRYLQTEEEFKQELQIQTEQQLAAVDMQNAMEQQQMDIQTANSVQGASNGI